MQDLIDNVVKWAEDRNLIEGSYPLKQVDKTAEELNELVAALGALAYGEAHGLAMYDVMDQAKDAIGDITVTLIIIAKQLDLSFEDCLVAAWNEIKDRKGKMVNGIFVKESA